MMEERKIFDDLTEGAPEDEIEEIAYLMNVKVEDLVAMFKPANRGLIRECLMKASHFDLLTKYFRYDSCQNSHISYQYSYITPLRLLLYDLYGATTNLDDVTKLFADFGKTMAYPQDVLRSFSEVERNLNRDGIPPFLGDLEKALQKRSYPVELRFQVKHLRDKCLRECVTEIDHRGRGSDMESGNAIPTLFSTGRNATRRTELQRYPIDRTRFYGYCLIINNVNFLDPCKFKKRNGSEKDANDLKTLFEDLDYEVILKNDVTKEELVSFLTDLQLKDFSNINVLVVFVLSHGEKDLFVLADGEKMDFQISLQEYFLPKYIPSLGGKPKLFFIQACQGTETYETFSMHEMGMNLVQDCLETDSGANSIPMESDIYFAVSTVPNYYSQRNVLNGGWYIQSLVTVMKEHARRYELHNIMTMVNDHLTQRRGSHGQTQCASVRKDTLRKICYLGRPLS